MSNLVYQNGYPFVWMHGEKIAPCMFRSFRPTPANLSLFHRAGIRIHQMLVSSQICGMDVPYSLFGGVWVDTDTYDFEAFDRQMDMFMRFTPGDYYVIFIQLDAPDAWIQSHTDAVSSFFNIQTMSLHEDFRQDAARYLRAMIAYCEEKYGEHICGYGISCGRSCEWFAGNDYNTELLRRAWQAHTGDPEAETPGVDPFIPGGELMRPTDSAHLDFLRFCEKNTADLACFFASEAQKELQHRKFLGLFGGYCMQSANTTLLNSFEQVWDSPDVDVIFSPAAYDEFRQPENASAMTVARDSIRLHGKMHLNELDHRTELAWYPMEHPVTPNRMKIHMIAGNFLRGCYPDFETSHMMLRRELASTLQSGSALWWFDFFGNYYASPEYEKMLSQHLNIWKRVAQTERPMESRAEVAMIVNTRASSYLKDGQNIHFDFVRHNLTALAKAGVPYEVYNLCDLEKMDHSRFRLYFFPNAFELSSGQLDFIRNKLADKAKLWLYAPGLILDGAADARHLCRATSIALEAFRPEAHAGVETPFGECQFTHSFQPMYRSIDPEAETLGVFSDGSGAGFVRKGNDFYIACGNLPTALIRYVAEQSGVHVYSRTDGALYMNDRFISFETTLTEEIELDLGRDCILEELFDGGVYRTQKGMLRYHAPKGCTKLFLFREG